MSDEVREKIYKISEVDMQPMESAQAFFMVYAPEGTPKDAPQKAEFWTHVARKLSPLCEVKIITKDGAWYARYLVLFVEGSNVQVKELEFHELDNTDELASESGDFEVTWGGPAHKFRVMRKSDKEVMRAGFANRSEAALWMHRNLAKAAA